LAVHHARYMLMRSKSVTQHEAVWVIDITGSLRLSEPMCFLVISLYRARAFITSSNARSWFLQHAFSCKNIVKDCGSEEQTVL